MVAGGGQDGNGLTAYVLVTPAKNEAANLPGLIQSIVNQVLQPIAWFIVDDGSDDGSSEIISRAASEHPWIHTVTLPSNTDYDLGKHLASVYIAGFERALAYCTQNQIRFDYIAVSDADMVYPEDYFARCVDFLRNNEQFGIVSGKILARDKNGDFYDEMGTQRGDGQPRGSGRVYRKATFLGTGGYGLVKAPDAVSNARALLRGWRLKNLPDVVCYQTRPTGGKHGLWNGYFHKGERRYYLGVNPLGLLHSVADIIFITRPENRITRGLALLLGYCKAWVRREERLDDEEVRRYNESYRTHLRSYWLFLRRLGKRGHRSV